MQGFVRPSKGSPGELVEILSMDCTGGCLFAGPTLLGRHTRNTAAAAEHPGKRPEDRPQIGGKVPRG